MGSGSWQQHPFLIPIHKVHQCMHSKLLKPRVMNQGVLSLGNEVRNKGKSGRLPITGMTNSTGEAMQLAMLLAEVKANKKQVFSVSTNSTDGPSTDGRI